MTVFETTRDFDASLEEVFDAIRRVERFARWLGPKGFSNTFETYEFKPGGRLVYVMHGPDGKNYPNQGVFTEIGAPHKVVIQHSSLPKYTLTLTLSAEGSGTRVHWAQAFEDDKVARAIAPIVVPANEENLDRWQAELVKGA